MLIILFSLLSFVSNLGLEVPAWLVHGYENPPSDQCFPVEPPSSGAAAAAAVAE